MHINISAQGLARMGDQNCHYFGEKDDQFLSTWSSGITAKTIYPVTSLK